MEKQPHPVETLTTNPKWKRLMQASTIEHCKQGGYLGKWEDKVMQRIAIDLPICEVSTLFLASLSGFKAFQHYMGT
jgi:hypothetical protein